MKPRTFRWKVLREDGGQALTEFVIVMPVVLLIFFALLQYFDVVRAAQLGNYAAYVAARSYAVRHSSDDALTAASLALAPTARAVPGELGDLNVLDLFHIDPVAIGLNLLQTVLGGNFGNFVDGYITARYIRLADKNFSVSKQAISGSTNQQATAVLNYAQPIYLPGLKQAWNFVSVGEDIDTELAPSAAGTEIWTQKAGKLNTFPYINIRSKCSTGYETWGVDGNGNAKPEWQPRQGNPDPDKWEGT